MRIQNKILVSFLLLTVLFSLVGSFAIYLFRSLSSEFHSIHEETFPLIVAVQDIRFAGLKISSAASEYCLENSDDNQIYSPERGESRLRLGREDYQRAFQVYDDLVVTRFPEKKSDLEALRLSGQLLHEQSDRVLAVARVHGPRRDVTTEKNLLDSAEQEFLAVVERILESENREIMKRDSAVHEMADKSRINLIFICVVLAVVACLIGVFVSRRLASPLVSLEKAAARVGNGELAVRVPVASQDEIGRLAHTFNRMAAELEKHHTRLEKMVAEKTEALSRANSVLLEEVRDRREVESHLRQREAELSAIIEGAATGINVVDLDGQILQVNPAFQKMLGYESQDLVGRHIAELTYVDDVAANIDLYQELIAGNRNHFHMAKRFVHSSGQPVWTQLTVSLIRDDSGNPLFVVGMVEDVTLRRQLEEERIKSSKLESIGVLAGGIAHDFNNILTAILGNIALALKACEDGGMAAKRLLAAEKASLRARALTQQLLAFAKGGTPVIRAGSVISLIREASSFPLSGSNVKCEYQISDDILPVDIDEGQIIQVIQNIVNNADQAMPDGGVITIRADNVDIDEVSSLPLVRGRYVRITVEDHGHGIAPEHIEKIFDPYFTTKASGSGLGLASSFSIVRNHNGHITVSSEVGRGTTFSIYLPASTRRTESLPVADRARFVRGSGRILIMDDEETIREFLSETLTMGGYTVDAVGEGAEAVAAYRRASEEGRPFSAVILDLTIPGGMGGKETMEKLIEFDPEVKAIVSSGYAKDPIMANYQQHGFKDVVPKPYKIEELSRVLAEVIKGQ